MAEKYKCNECQSTTRNRKLDDTPLGSAVKRYVEIPDRCSNTNCPNSDPQNHESMWATLVPG